MRHRYIAISDAIRALSPDATLIAVSKTHPVEAVEELYRLGHRDFGENYVQELTEKAEALKARGCPWVRWHFIGHLQTNKVKALIPWVHTLHTLDSRKLALEIQKRAAPLDRKIQVFLDVNVDGQESKTGISPEAVPELARTVAEECPALELQGLMCIPDPKKAQDGNAFRKLRELELSLGSLSRRKLSMGMTADFQVALREGSTHVRVGTAIFGPRN